MFMVKTYLKTANLHLQLSNQPFVFNILIIKHNISKYVSIHLPLIIIAIGFNSINDNLLQSNVNYT